ncbi:MAG: hypothetical protein WKG32_10885 [Gemmatimonadaceae bacterium]
MVVEDTLTRLLVWLDRHGLASYDFADILRSPIVRALTFRRHLAERVAIQFGKHFPFNIRPLLGITPHVSSQTLALLCSARAWQYASGWKGTTEEMVRNAAHLLIADSLGPGGVYLWGQKLMFSARFVRATPSTPNLFQTSNAIHGLLDAYQVVGDRALAEVATQAAHDCVARLGFLTAPTGGGLYMRYYPGVDVPVYNVNALFSAACCRLADLGIGAVDTHRQRAEDLLAFVLRGQRPDGAWPYAAHESGQWVDGYHTGYVIEAIGYFLASSLGATVEEPVRVGLRYFADRLIDDDGCPKYFDHSRYPIDVQNCAQAIQTIARLAPRGDVSLGLLERTVTAVVRELFLPDEQGGGYFAATRRPWIVNRTPYVRWGQAPMALALTHAWNAERGGTGYGKGYFDPGGAIPIGRSADGRG